MQPLQYLHVEFTATRGVGGRKRNLCINIQSIFNHRKIWPLYVRACLLTLSCSMSLPLIRES